MPNYKDEQILIVMYQSISIATLVVDAFFRNLKTKTNLFIIFLIFKKVYMTLLLRGRYIFVRKTEPLTDMMNNKNVYAIFRNVV